MKKSLFNIAMALCIGLFASCSQEEIISQLNDGEETVSISAQLPGNNAHTRALPTVDENHQLRCILEVWNTAEGGTLITRIEKLASEATVDGKLQFAFTVDKNITYQCLLWADFIDATAQTEGNAAYTDKYYSTTNLKAIDFKATDASLFNNAASDAFCGVVNKNGTTTELSVTLKRPFTKVTLKDNSTYIDDVTGLGVEYDAPSGYNIATGTATSTQNIQATGLQVKDKTWFSTFIFASVDKQKLDQDITLTVTKKNGTETKKIKGGQISLDGNVENNAEANFAAEEDVKIDVDVDGDMEDPNAPKIGYFVNKDGSCTEAYDANNAIGIVFAVGAKGADTGANYGENFSGKKIYGYAMGLTSVTRSPINQKVDNTLIDFPDLTGINTSTDTSAPWAADDYNGYKYTQTLEGVFTDEVKASKLITNYTNWKKTNAATGFNLSPWYIPSSRQLADIIGMAYGCEEKVDNNVENVKIPAFTQNNTFAAAITTSMPADENAKSYFGNHASTANIMTSFIRSGRIMCVQTSYTSSTEAINAYLGVAVPVVAPNSGTGSPFVIRPVLTIFKP